MSELELTRIFVKVIECGGFSRAAAALQLPKSSVSKAIARLEQRLATKLLVRTTRAVTATAAGRAYHEQCAAHIAALDRARSTIAGRDRAVAGRMRITAPEDLGAHIISPAIAELASVHPQLSFELRYTDEVLDLVRDGFDLAIRLGTLRASRLYAKRLGESTLVAVASPAYLEQAPRIRRPEELTKHACLSINLASSHWRLSGPRGRVRVPIEPRVTCNQMSSLLALALRGAGIAMVPMFLCRGELAVGRLVRVLPGWTRPGLAVSMVSPLPSSSSARLKVVTDHLATVIPPALAP